MVTGTHVGTRGVHAQAVRPTQSQEALVQVATFLGIWKQCVTRVTVANFSAHTDQVADLFTWVVFRWALG